MKRIWYVVSKIVALYLVDEIVDPELILIDAN